MTRKNWYKSTTEYTEPELIWQVAFPRDFAPLVESVVRAAVFTTLILLDEYIAIRLGTTLEAFENWLYSHYGDATMLGTQVRPWRRDKGFSADKITALLTMSVGYARMMLTFYKLSAMPSGRSLRGIQRWLMSPFDTGAQAMLVAALVSEKYQAMLINWDGIIWLSNRDGSEDTVGSAETAASKSNRSDSDTAGDSEEDDEQDGATVPECLTTLSVEAKVARNYMLHRASARVVLSDKEHTSGVECTLTDSEFLLVERLHARVLARLRRSITQLADADPDA